MAQVPFRVNLSAATFPLVSTYMGQSVVIPNLDESSYRRRQGADIPEYDLGVPQIYYCENVMPETQGYKSIHYVDTLQAPTSITDFNKVIPLRDILGNRGLLGLTTSGKAFIFSTVASYTWVDITAAIGTWNGQESSVAYINGITYICLSKHDVYKVDLVANTLTSVTLLGIVKTDVTCISSCSSYMFLFTDTQVAWSSTINPEDFVPSLISGAGGGSIQGLQGIIIYVGVINGGLAIYSTVNIVIVQYTQNFQEPFNYNPAINSAGINSSKQVAEYADNGCNYAWTGGGLLKITIQGCLPVFPEVTDFLSSRQIEDFHLFQLTQFVVTQLTANINVKLTFVGDRYLIISYGITTYTYALVYDTVLNRWGKLKVPHVDCISLNMAVNTPLTFAQVTQSYAALAAQAYADLVGLGNSAPDPRRTCMFVSNTGKLTLMTAEYNDLKYGSIVIAGGEFVGSLILLGKYQLARSEMTTLHRIDIEGVSMNNPSMQVSMYKSLDGKTVDVPLFIGLEQSTIGTPILTYSGENIRKYETRFTGVNHSILIQGVFNINSMSLWVTKAGRR